MCSNPSKTNGADCDDGNMCNGISTCQSGVCTQTTPPVTCPASDACHSAGTCNTSTGMCSNPAKTDGADCDDGNMCNGISTCQSGVCTQTTPPVTCTASDACHTAGTCNTSTGTCSNPAKTDGADCDDGNMCNGKSGRARRRGRESMSVVAGSLSEACHTARTCHPS